MIEKKEDIVDWNKNKLDDISFITMGQSPYSSNYNDEKIGMPLLQGNADIFERETVPRKYTTQITKTCNVGDILISVRAPVGTIAISKHKAVIGRGLASIKAKDKITSEFLFQYLLSMENKWNKISQGSTFNSINSSDLKNVIIPTPAINEQKKIAEILSAWDDAISGLTRMIDLQSDYRLWIKKSLITKHYKEQRMLKNYKKLESFLKTKNEKVLNRNIEPVAVGINGIRLRSEIYDKELSNDYSDNKVIRKNDLCFGIGTNNIVYDVLLEDKVYCVSPAYKVYAVNGVDPFYLKSYLDTFNTYYSKKHMIISARQGKSVDMKGLLNEKVYVPSYDEQIKFSKVIHSIDEYIKTLNDELKAIKLQKQGLMQQLLTGKIRVNTD